MDGAVQVAEKSSDLFHEMGNRRRLYLLTPIAAKVPCIMSGEWSWLHCEPSAKSNSQDRFYSKRVAGEQGVAMVLA